MLCCLSPVDWLAQTSLPGSGWHPRSSCWRTRPGIRPQLPTPLLSRWCEVDHLEGPLEPGCRQDFCCFVLFKTKLWPSVSCTNQSTCLNVNKFGLGGNKTRNFYRIEGTEKHLCPLDVEYKCSVNHKLFTVLTYRVIKWHLEGRLVNIQYLLIMLNSNVDFCPKGWNNCASGSHSVSRYTFVN